MTDRTTARERARAAFKRRVANSLKAADEAFKGKYGDELNELLGLSQDELDEITPDATDLKTYNALIAVVREASRVNLAQADLAERIKNMGQVALAIAGKVPTLAKLLGA